MKIRSHRVLQCYYRLQYMAVAVQDQTDAHTPSAQSCHSKAPHRLHLSTCSVIVHHFFRQGIIFKRAGRLHKEILQGSDFGLHRGTVHSRSTAGRDIKQKGLQMLPYVSSSTRKHRLRRAQQAGQWMNPPTPSPSPWPLPYKREMRVRVVAPIMA